MYCIIEILQFQPLNRSSSFKRTYGEKKMYSPNLIIVSLQEMVMRINADLHILELEWEDLDSIQLNSPTHIQKYLADTKVI